jgi:hypothetical protein
MDEKIFITPDEFDKITGDPYFLIHEIFPTNEPYEIGRARGVHYICKDWKAWREYVDKRRRAPQDLWHFSGKKESE